MISRNDYLDICRRIGNQTAGTAADIGALAALAREAGTVDFRRDAAGRAGLVARLLAYLEAEIPRCPDLAPFIPIVQCFKVKRTE